MNITVINVSSESACVTFEPPPNIEKRNIERFEVG